MYKLKDLNCSCVFSFWFSVWSQINGRHLDRCIHPPARSHVSAVQVYSRCMCQLADELNLLKFSSSGTTQLLYFSSCPSFFLGVFEHTAALAVTLPFDSTFFIWSNTTLVCFPSLHLCSLFLFFTYYFFSPLFLSLSFRVCYPALLTFVCRVAGPFFIPRFCSRWDVSFFYLTCAMWLSLFLWSSSISCENKWTVNSRWQFS